MSKLKTILKQGFWRPAALWRTLRYSKLRRTTGTAKLIVTPWTRIEIARGAKLNLLSNTILGFKKYKGSRIETSLWMGEDASITLGPAAAEAHEKRIVVYHGCDIQIFKGASLSIKGPCVMNRNAQIICQESICIGSECLISRDVVIRDNDGGHRVLVDGYKPTAPVEIGDHVWIGQGAIILKGSKIGDNAIIGAGAVVQGRVKAGSLIMADPSRTFAKDINWEH